MADDNAASRTALVESLSSWGMSPVAADGAAAAVAELRRAAAGGRPFAALLLDDTLPGVDSLQLVRQIRSQPHLTPQAILLLSGAQLPVPAGQWRAAGAAACLLKPIHETYLLRALTAALRPAAVPAGSPGVAAPLGALAPRRLRVLLAEDNVVNQRLAVRLLERAGHSVVLAGDGVQALAALEREAFDLVLMDVQMPVMDGLEATATLRENERGTGRRLPVVALTANAMRGDREVCLVRGWTATLANRSWRMTCGGQSGRSCPRSACPRGGSLRRLIPATHG